MNREQEDHLYAQVAREVTEGIRYPAPLARAAEKSAGNADLAKSLYIKFRVEQIAREREQEARRCQDELERVKRNLKEEARRQRIESEQAERAAKIEARRQQIESAQIENERLRRCVSRELEIRKAERGELSDGEKFTRSFILTLFFMIAILILFASLS